jgi:hypothetical protein
MLKEFIKICQMTQPQLKNYVQNELLKTHPIVTSDDGFVFAEGNFPVLLVAHLDTVHKEPPKKILYSNDGDTISSPQGIGGDDRCGVYMIFEVLKKFNCSVLFCEDEEIGMVGAEKFIDTKLAEKYISAFNYIIEFDRKGDRDAVFYDCDNPEFEEFITYDFFGTAYGSFSDISTVAPFLECAAVNLSCGYYKAHTTDEYVIFSEMEASIAEACEILAKTTPEDKFEYIEARHYNSKWWSDFSVGKYDSWGDELYTIIYMSKGGDSLIYTTVAMSDAEAIGNFLMDNPDYCFNDVIDYGTDYDYQ